MTTYTANWTYRDLLAAACSLARSLVANPEFTPGSRVVLLLPNSPEYIAGFHGILLAGGVAVPIPPRTEPGLLRKIVESTEAAAIVTDSQLASTRADLPLGSRQTVELSDGVSIDSCPPSEVEGKSDNELAAIFFTGGSTGTPKGVMLSHRNLISNARSIQQYLRITADERPLCVLPFHHAFGNSVWQSHLLAGAHVILDGQTSFPETLIAALARHTCTSLSGVPDLFRLLLERSSLGQTSLPNLRYLAVAGGALPHELSLELARRIAPAEFFVMYGQTEATARLAYLPPEQLGKMPQTSIGQAIPGVTLEVVDADNRPVPTGEVGELRAAGDNVMLGYWRDLDSTAKRIRWGWLYTGDLATRDEAGFISIARRSDSIVKIAGFRVQPEELEEFAVRRLGVAQAVAIPADLPGLGTRLTLFTRHAAPAAPLALSEMIARCRAELPRHLVPELIQVVEEFPLNAAMKIDRPRLQRLAEVAWREARRAPA